MNIQRNFERTVNRSIQQETRKTKNRKSNSIINYPNNIAYRIMEEALYNIKANIIMLDRNKYLIEIDMFLPENIMENLEKVDKENYTILVSRNERKCITSIMIYENIKEKNLW